MIRSIVACVLILPGLMAAPEHVSEEEPDDTAPSPERTGIKVDISDRDAVRLFYLVRFRAPPPANAVDNADKDKCIPGTTSAALRQDALARMNSYRALAGVPADWEEDPVVSAQMQAAAMVIAANRRMAHELTPDWKCFDDATNKAVAIANLGIGAIGADAVDQYMLDGGNDNTGANHRRWVLYPHTRKVGIGGYLDQEQRTSAFSGWDDLYNTSRPNTRNGFVAWPPAGWTPWQLVFPRWSFSYPGADFSEAIVEANRNGIKQDVVVEPNDEGAGEPSVVWHVNGAGNKPVPVSGDQTWQIHIANVRVFGEPHQFDYTVHIFDPDQGPLPNVALRGASDVHTGELVTFNIEKIKGASSRQWQMLSLNRLNVTQSADDENGLFESSGQIERSSDVQDKHRSSFRLIHDGAGNAILHLKYSIICDQNTQLSFRQKLGVAGQDEITEVELKVFGEDQWRTIWRRNGGGGSALADKEFNDEHVSLAQWAGEEVELRLRYAFLSGSFFPAQDTRVGWYIDSIKLDGAWAIENRSKPQTIHGNQLTLTPDHPGAFLLRARPLVYKMAGDWGRGVIVAVH